MTPSHVHHAPLHDDHPLVPAQIDIGPSLGLLPFTDMTVVRHARVPVIIPLADTTLAVLIDLHHGHVIVNVPLSAFTVINLATFREIVYYVVPILSKV